jgi:hypothetical protein
MPRGSLEGKECKQYQEKEAEEERKGSSRGREGKGTDGSISEVK